MSRKSRCFHYFTLFSLLCVFIFFTMGCSHEQTVEQRTLRIDGYTGSSDTRLFEYAFPDIKIEQTVRLNDDEMMEGNRSVRRIKELLKGPTPPDVLVLDYPDYIKLMEEGWLTSFDPLLSASDDLSESDFLPSVIDLLRQKGDGQLYGLTPTFQSAALIYNKQLFQEAGVPEPKDTMNWDELFSLARQVTSDQEANRVYGFHFRGNYFAPRMEDVVNYYTASIGLPVVDQQRGEMMVNTSEWKQALEQILQLYHENVLPGHAKRSVYNPYGSIENNSFFSGELAMSIISYGELISLISTNEQAQLIRNFEPIDFGLVGMPYHADDRNVMAGLQPSQIFSIPANAENAEDAWGYITFIMLHSGELYSHVRTIPTLRSLADQQALGLPFDLALFYPEDMEINQGQTTDVEILVEGNTLLMGVFSDQLTVEQALERWETAGNRLLLQRN